jgi:uncharacterized protein involved in tolerance to divalent cations
MPTNSSSVDKRINGWLEKIVAICIATSVSATAAFQWQLYKSNEDIKALLKVHDSKISYLDNRITELQLEVSEVRSQMVGWDTLKRIELFLSSKNPIEIDSRMSSALKMELESRTEKHSTQRKGS